MPCHVDITAADEAKHFEVLLCQACKFLTAVQIESLSNPRNPGMSEGIDWYASHVMSDYSFNDNKAEKAAAYKELRRLGFDVIEEDENHCKLVREIR